MRTRQLLPDTEVGLLTVGMHFNSFAKMVNVQVPKQTSVVSHPALRESSDSVGR